MNNETVMYLIVRNDLGMSPGKVAAQVGHGVELALANGRRFSPQWMPTDLPCAKIVLQANYDEIETIYFGIGAHKATLVIDEGRTEVPPNSITVLAMVPAPKSEFSEQLKHLRLYR